MLFQTQFVPEYVNSLSCQMHVECMTCLYRLKVWKLVAHAAFFLTLWSVTEPDSCHPGTAVWIMHLSTIHVEFHRFTEKYIFRSYRVKHSSLTCY